MTYKFLFLNFSQPFELCLLIFQFIGYFNQYYIVVFIFGPLPFISILLLTLINFLALNALINVNQIHQSVEPKTEHTQYCKRCKTWVIHRDHHCIFTGRCVQKQNYRYFISYIFYTYLLSCFLLQTIVRQYQILLNFTQIELKNLIPIIFGLGTSAYFFIFTGGLLAGSVRSIIFGIYTVEELKKQKQPKYTNSQLRKMWFSSSGRKELWSSFKQNWKIMIGSNIGVKEILYPI